MASPIELTELQREFFVKISANDVAGLKQLVAQLKTSIDFVDENGMSPLQHACYKQNAEAVQCLLDRVRTKDHVNGIVFGICLLVFFCDWVLSQRHKRKNRWRCEVR